MLDFTKGEDELIDYLQSLVGKINVKDDIALKQWTVYACIRILADSVSTLSLKLYQETEENNVIRVSDHYMSDKLQGRLCTHMNNKQFWSSIVAQDKIYGNAYVVIQTNKKGKIENLLPLKSECMDVWVDDRCILDDNFKIWYIYRDGAAQYKFSADEILHFQSGVTLNGLMSLSEVEQGKEIIENGKASQQYINGFFKNGLSAKGIIHYTGDLNDVGEELIRTRFEKMASGIKNAHRIAVMPLGTEYKDISQKLCDAQFIELNNMNVLDIANIFGIKAHQLNHLERATYNNTTEAQRDFYISTLQPLLTSYEQELNNGALTSEERKKGMYYLFNVDAILRADIKTRYESYRIAIQAGFMTPNEARRKENMKTMDGADILLVNGSMTPIELAGSAYMKGGDKGEQGEIKK